MTKLKSINSRWDIAIPGDKETTLSYAASHFFHCYEKALVDHQAFYVALSGGSTPKAIFEKLTSNPYKETIDWTKIYFFWSDERAVPPDHPDSNFHMAMNAGLANMQIPKEHLFRMKAENNIEESALEYEKAILHILKNKPFDLMMLGMGDDGHTASLFPKTKGLHETNHLVVANYIPQKSCWRMSMTFKQINHARHIAIYVLGSSKQEVLKKVLASSNPTLEYPITYIGTSLHKALWIVDKEASPLI